MEVGASDLHLAVSNPPVVRVNGALKMVLDGEGQVSEHLTSQGMEEILHTIAGPEDVTAFQREKELDFSYACNGLARFRVNSYYQRGPISLSF